ncbi:hypothetical protein BB558_000805 [Smittium angustum]|uniref:Uncharacterized protein n=1 Tax=Smittium angustum TaxID=133377 RepID=A0A2U1JDH2_SMIAN|nr:hypothetical protein BB558_000805 [Smittium angustum]
MNSKRKRSEDNGSEPLPNTKQSTNKENGTLSWKKAVMLLFWGQKKELSKQNIKERKRKESFECPREDSNGSFRSNRILTSASLPNISSPDHEVMETKNKERVIYNSTINSFFGTFNSSSKNENIPFYSDTQTPGAPSTSISCTKKALNTSQHPIQNKQPVTPSQAVTRCSHCNKVLDATITCYCFSCGHPYCETCCTLK